MGYDQRLRILTLMALLLVLILMLLEWIDRANVIGAPSVVFVPLRRPVSQSPDKADLSAAE